MSNETPDPHPPGGTGPGFHEAARDALLSCLGGQDERATDLLRGLTDEQLYAVEAAASALAIHASRLRDPAGDDLDEMVGTRSGPAFDERAEWERDLLDVDRPIQGWMALDLHQALGLPVDHRAEAVHQGHPSWAAWWTDLLTRVRRLRHDPEGQPETVREGEADR